MSFDEGPRTSELHRNNSMQFFHLWFFPLNGRDQPKNKITFCVIPLPGLDKIWIKLGFGYLVSPISMRFSFGLDISCSPRSFFQLEAGREQRWSDHRIQVASCRSDGDEFWGSGVSHMGVSNNRGTPKMDGL